MPKPIDRQAGQPVTEPAAPQEHNSFSGHPERVGMLRELIIARNRREAERRKELGNKLRGLMERPRRDNGEHSR